MLIDGIVPYDVRLSIIVLSMFVVSIKHRNTEGLGSELRLRFGSGLKLDCF